MIGKIKLTVEFSDANYSGELDENGKACGFGVAVHKKEGFKRVYRGTWLDNKRHGLSKLPIQLIQLSNLYFR